MINDSGSRKGHLYHICLPQTSEMAVIVTISIFRNKFAMVTYYSPPIMLKTILLGGSTLKCFELHYFKGQIFNSWFKSLAKQPLAAVSR